MASRRMSRHIAQFVRWRPAAIAGLHQRHETEGSARLLLVGASVTSLLGAGYALHLAGQKSGAPRMLLIGAAVLTVMLSWAVINTIYTLR